MWCQPGCLTMPSSTGGGGRRSCARPRTSPRSRRARAARSSSTGARSWLRRLSDAGLIDQYNLLVFPVLLGAGKSLSRAGRDKHMLTLRESESYSNGILKLVYDVKR